MHCVSIDVWRQVPEGDVQPWWKNQHSTAHITLLPY